MKRLLVILMTATALILSFGGCAKEAPPETVAPANADPADGGKAKPQEAPKPAAEGEKKNTLRDKE